MLKIFKDALPVTHIALTYDNGDWRYLNLGVNMRNCVAEKPQKTWRAPRLQRTIERAEDEIYAAYSGIISV